MGSPDPFDTDLVEHGLLAFASSELYRPAEQDRVETVEHDRRRDQKVLDAQGEHEIRPHRGFADEAQAPHDVAEADGVSETSRTVPAVVHPGQPGLVVASHEIPGEKEAERTGEGIRKDERQPNSGGDERLADQVQARIAPQCYQPNRQADRKQYEPGQEIDAPPAHNAHQRVQQRRNTGGQEGWQLGNLELVVQDKVDEVRRDAVDQDARAEAAYQWHDALWALRAGRRTWAGFARPGRVLRRAGGADC